jgi:hypothetical protein
MARWITQEIKWHALLWEQLQGCVHLVSSWALQTGSTLCYGFSRILHCQQVYMDAKCGQQTSFRGTHLLKPKPIFNICAF